MTFSGVFDALTKHPYFLGKMHNFQAKIYENLTILINPDNNMYIPRTLVAIRSRYR